MRKLPPNLKRRRRNICTSARVEAFLLSRPESASQLIEAAMLQTYDIPTISHTEIDIVEKNDE